MNQKNKIVYGGYVKSKSDGDIHYISAYKLLRLYKFRSTECILIDEWESVEEKLRSYFIGGMQWYRPRQDGNYDTE